VFENDKLSAYLGRMVRGVVADIDLDFAKMQAQPDDGKRIRVLMAGIAILGVLSENFTAARCNVLKSQVARWRDGYFAWFDAYNIELDDPDWSREERQIHQAEFDRLYELAFDEP
jgi:hypothetical protein